jgi:C4-dicarboxylate-binding protein DctP
MPYWCWPGDSHMKGSAAFLAFLILAVTAFAGRAEQRIELIHPGSSTAPLGQAAGFFAEQVNTRLSGRVRVAVSPDSLPENGTELFELLRGGDAKSGIMAVAPLAQLSALEPRLLVFELPLLFSDLTEVHKLVDSEVGGKLLAPLEASGVKGLAVWDEGMTVFSVNGIRPLRESPADFVGKRFCSQGQGIEASTIRALGGALDEISAAEVYDALAQRTLDGCTGSWSQIFANGYQEVQDWISVSDHSYRGYLVAIGAELWNGLPDDIRGQLQAVLAEATAKARELAAQSQTEYRQRIQETGRAAVLGLTSQERATWRASTREVVSQYEARIGSELMSEVRSLLEH